MASARVRAVLKGLRACKVAKQRGQPPCSELAGSAKSHTVHEIVGVPMRGAAASRPMARHTERRSRVARHSIAATAARIKQIPPKPIPTGIGPQFDYTPRPRLL